LAQEKLQKNMHSKIIAKILLRFTKINKLPRQGGVKQNLSFNVSLYKISKPAYRQAGAILFMCGRGKKGFEGERW
jgi:hypothetical protein